MRLARFERAIYPLKGRTPFALPKMIKYHFRTRVKLFSYTLTKQMEKLYLAELLSRFHNSQKSIKIRFWGDSINARTGTQKGDSLAGELQYSLRLKFKQ